MIKNQPVPMHPVRGIRLLAAASAALALAMAGCGGGSAPSASASGASGSSAVSQTPAAASQTPAAASQKPAAPAQAAPQASGPHSAAINSCAAKYPGDVGELGICLASHGIEVKADGQLAACFQTAHDSSAVAKCLIDDIKQ